VVLDLSFDPFAHYPRPFRALHSRVARVARQRGTLPSQPHASKTHAADPPRTIIGHCPPQTCPTEAASENRLWHAVRTLGSPLVPLPPSEWLQSPSSLLQTVSLEPRHPQTPAELQLRLWRQLLQLPRSVMPCHFQLPAKAEFWSCGSTQYLPRFALALLGAGKLHKHAAATTALATEAAWVVATAEASDSAQCEVLSHKWTRDCGLQGGTPP